MKVFEFDRFTDGIRFVDAVAEVADRLEHHPDIGIRYTTVTLSVQTHSEGGITQWDIQLARAIDKLGKGPQAELSPEPARPSRTDTSIGETIL